MNVTSREQYPEQPEQPEQQHGPDTGDMIDKDAHDPTGERVSDPEHPDYVEPYADATPVRGDDDDDAPPAVPEPR